MFTKIQPQKMEIEARMLGWGFLDPHGGTWGAAASLVGGKGVGKRSGAQCDASLVHWYDDWMWGTGIMGESSPSGRKFSVKIVIYHWLVVWNIHFIFPFSWEFHHPNWLSYFSEGWLNHQPVLDCEGNLCPYFRGHISYRKLTSWIPINQGIEGMILDHFQTVEIRPT